MEKVFTIEIPDYKTHACLVEKREQKYYNRCSRIPQKYRNNGYGFNAYGLLHEKSTGQLVIANPRTSGKPIMKEIDGHAILTGRMRRKEAVIIVREVERYYADQLKHLKIHGKLNKVAIEIINSPVEGSKDIKNLGWLLVKVIQETLSEGGFVGESVDQSFQGFEIRSIPSAMNSERKMIFNFYSESKRRSAV
jgi:hypothetical protein